MVRAQRSTHATRRRNIAQNLSERFANQVPRRERAHPCCDLAHLTARSLAIGAQPNAPHRGAELRSERAEGRFDTPRTRRASAKRGADATSAPEPLSFLRFFRKMWIFRWILWKIRTYVRLNRNFLIFLGREVPFIDNPLPIFPLCFWYRFRFDIFKVHFGEYFLFFVFYNTPV